MIRNGGVFRGPSAFGLILQGMGLPVPETEYRFFPARKWRFDHAWPAQMLALEVEGGIWTQGRHNRSRGFLGDMEKYNQATLLGWRVLRCTTEMMKSGDAVLLVQRALGKSRS